MGTPRAAQREGEQTHRREQESADQRVGLDAELPGSGATEQHQRESERCTEVPAHPGAGCVALWW